MTFEIGLILALVFGALVLFVLEKPRSDVVALMLMGTLAATGLLEPKEALSGFSNPAVVTVWAVFILSGGLSRTGVANVLGSQVLRMAGTSEVRLMVLIMLVAGVLSAFMNNVGATALLLPVVMDLARRTGIAPSKLLIPLSFSSLLGGMLTLIGTPPNILVAEAVRERGLDQLGMFSFLPMGAIVLLVGIVYMVVIGRRLLPSRDVTQAAGTSDLRDLFGLHKRLLVLEIPEGSPLEGLTVAESRVQEVLGLTVIGIERGGRTRLAPAPNDLLQAGDQLLVEGRAKRLEELQESPALSVARTEMTLGKVSSDEIVLEAVEVAEPSKAIGQTVRQLEFRDRYGAVVVAIQRDGAMVDSRIDTLPLEPGDVLLLQATPSELDGLVEDGAFERRPTLDYGLVDLEDRLLRITVPEGSFLVGKRLDESRLAEALGLIVLSLTSGDEATTRPGPDRLLQAGDVLVVKGEPRNLEIVRGLQGLRLERRIEHTVEQLESSQVGLSVAAIAPNARQLVGQTLRQLHFREKYGLGVLAIWRQGRVVRRGLGDEPLAFGDALLLHGPRDSLALLSDEPDFLVLNEEMQPPPDYEKMPWALAAMAGVLAATLSGWLPIYIAAVLGATMMVLTGCLPIQEAYREIEWRAVFLIAGMLPLGLAMQKTGAALMISEGVVDTIGSIGPLAILGGIFVLAVTGAQVMPTSAVAVLLAPIAIDTALQAGISPLPLVMAVAIGASTAFISPVTHPANVLVMGPGGYRFIDYVKVGAPLAVLILIVVVLVLPLVWPL